MKAGEKFRFLETIEDSFYKRIKGRSHAFIKCKCICGKIKDVRVHDLNRGAAKSCGCKGIEPKNWIGYKFNCFEVISDKYKRQTGNRNVNYMDCKCVCGEIRSISFQQVKAGSRYSCGCKRNPIINENTRACSQCKEIKSLDDFKHCGTTKSGRGSTCKLCVRKSSLMKLYGITQEDYNKLLKQQNNKCLICGTDNPNKIFIKRNHTSFAIDHCHKTGKVRGLLCFSCNIAIGYLEENSNTIYKAYLYLKNFEDSLLYH